MTDDILDNQYQQIHAYYERYKVMTLPVFSY